MEVVHDSDEYARNLSHASEVSTLFHLAKLGNRHVPKIRESFIEPGVRPPRHWIVMDHVAVDMMMNLHDAL